MGIFRFLGLCRYLWMFVWVDGMYKCLRESMSVWVAGRVLWKFMGFRVSMSEYGYL